MSYVTDTTVLSNFAAIGHLDLLRGLFGTLNLSTEVLAEVRAGLVAAEERGRSTGARLMEAMLAALADSGRYDCVSLTVNEAQSAAVGLYRRFGFEVIDHVAAILGDGHEHRELVMARPLP